MDETFIPNSDYNTRTWYILDAENRRLGRMASAIAYILQGKHKTDYHPSTDSGDYIIIINARLVTLDSSALGNVKYRVYNPGRPGHSLKLFIEDLPRLIVEGAVKNMLPDSLRQNFHTRLKVYSTSEHPHEAQNPIPVDLG